MYGRKSSPWHPSTRAHQEPEGSGASRRAHTVRRTHARRAHSVGGGREWADVSVVCRGWCACGGVPCQACSPPLHCRLQWDGGLRGVDAVVQCVVRAPTRVGAHVARSWPRRIVWHVSGWDRHVVACRAMPAARPCIVDPSVGWGSPQAPLRVAVRCSCVHTRMAVLVARSCLVAASHRMAHEWLGPARGAAQGPLASTASLSHEDLIRAWGWGRRWGGCSLDAPRDASAARRTPHGARVHARGRDTLLTSHLHVPRVYADEGLGESANAALDRAAPGAERDLDA